MLALMKPSSVATRSSTRGTSRGCTVVTKTSGGGGAVGAGLREQAEMIETPSRSPARVASRFIDLLSLTISWTVEPQIRRPLPVSALPPDKFEAAALRVEVAHSSHLLDRSARETIQCPTHHYAERLGYPRRPNSVYCSPEPPGSKPRRGQVERSGLSSKVLDLGVWDRSKRLGGDVLLL